MQVYDPKKLGVLHFQHQMYDLENDHFEVLERDQFCNELQQYLTRLFDLGHNSVILRVLGKVGQCATDHPKQSLRENALLVVTEFISILNSQKDKEFYQVVTKILTDWLYRAREYYFGIEKIFSRIDAILRKMFSLQFWSESEALLSAVHSINCGKMVADKHFRNQVNKLHCGVADEKDIDSLIESFLNEKSPDHLVERKLLMALAPHSTEKMIEALIKSNNKVTRLTLLEMISEDVRGILPVLVEKLRDRQPWYVVRNCMIMLGAIGDPDLYPFASACLCHSDSRVHRQVLACIAALGGPEVAGRLISSFYIVNDDVKVSLIECLDDFDDPRIEEIYLSILEQRMNITLSVRDDIVLRICNSSHLRPSPRAVLVLNDIANESRYGFSEDDPVAQAVKNVLTGFENRDNLS